MSVALTKSAILSAKDKRVEKVDTPEWGGHVYVCSLSGEQKDELEEQLTSSDSHVGLRAWFAAAGLCDEGGNSLGFTPKEVDELSRKNAAPLERIVDKVREISADTAEAVEELEKNSEVAPSGSDGSS